MLRADYTGQFKKDYKLAVKRGLDIDVLEKVIVMIMAEEPLPDNFHDHQLLGR